MPDEELPPADYGWTDSVSEDVWKRATVLEIVRKAVQQERQACANIAISWSDKSYEAEQIAAEILARPA